MPIFGGLSSDTDGHILSALCIGLRMTRQEDSRGQEPILRKCDYLQPKALVIQEEREARLMEVACAHNPRTRDRKISEAHWPASLA